MFVFRLSSGMASRVVFCTACMGQPRAIIHESRRRLSASEVLRPSPSVDGEPKDHLHSRPAIVCGGAWDASIVQSTLLVTPPLASTFATRLYPSSMFTTI
jgi:hypothetical protein